MRLRATRVLGWDEEPVVIVSVPPDIEAQWNLKDNKQWGGCDDAALAELILARRWTELSAGNKAEPVRS